MQDGSPVAPKEKQPSRAEKLVAALEAFLEAREANPSNDDCDAVCKERANLVDWIYSTLTDAANFEL